MDQDMSRDDSLLYLRALRVARQGYDCFGDFPTLIRHYVLAQVGEQHDRNPIIDRAIRNGNKEIEVPDGLDVESLRGAIRFLQAFRKVDKRE